MSEGFSEEQRHKLKFEKRRMQPTYTVPPTLPCFMRIQGGQADFTYFFDKAGNAFVAWRLVDLSRFAIPELSAEDFFRPRTFAH